MAETRQDIQDRLKLRLDETVARIASEHNTTPEKLLGYARDLLGVAVDARLQTSPNPIGRRMRWEDEKQRVRDMGYDVLSLGRVLNLVNIWIATGRLDAPDIAWLLMVAEKAAHEAAAASGSEKA